MRSVWLALLVLGGVASVLVFSVRTLRGERERLRESYVASREAEVRALASDVQDRLRDVAEDGRVIETLVERTYDAPGRDRNDRTRTLRASFTAMATVIRHYSTLVLLSPDAPAPLVVAADPTEEPSVARALVDMSTGRQTHRSPVRALLGPVQLPGGRVFYLLTFPAGLNEVVISIDAPVFLQSTVPSVSDGLVVITDARGNHWVRSTGTLPFSIRPTSAETDEVNRWSGDIGSAWLAERTAQGFGLPVGSTLAVWASVGHSEFGTWQVLLLKPARYLQARERVILRQVILTAASLLVAIGIIGTLIVRQQRYSAALADRLRTAEALRSLERQLISAEKLGTSGVLATGIAHEIGTPLGIIRARAELLLDETDPAQGRRAIEAIVQQIDRISSIIRQVLDFSRVQPVELGHVDVGETVGLVLELVGHRLRQQGITASVDVPPHLPALAADGNQLQQVFLNVVLNACDACETGGRIQLTARPVDGAQRIQLEICDSGIGIQPEHLLAVFDPFFTTKKRGEGTGLGLPIAASIVRNHGGEITLASTAGNGTIVTIIWPAIPGGGNG